MAQDERDYWYRPKEFRASHKGSGQNVASHPDVALSKGQNNNDVSWHWFEFVLGFVVCVGLLLFFPDKMVQLLNYLSSIIFEAFALLRFD
ncbi:hypothetical protein [Rheinheimera hassiensis]|uniref:hypothetical protein n=1 Tax=Rheinheimera hassiensis TaxID=1193627 RepID=UPI001F0661D9|nr:hypothetical protein [Rheinheimera hassiensis]